MDERQAGLIGKNEARVYSGLFNVFKKSKGIKMTHQIAVLNERDLFELADRKAHALACSDIVPAAYKGNKANCLLALNMAHRMGCDPLMVMQNVYVIQGRPSMSSQFLIAAFNKSKAFSTIKYEFTGVEGQDSWGCRASAIERETGEKHTGTLVTIGMAKAEGWSKKSGSKWKAMPELMLRYRSAAFFIRQTCPEIALGFQTDDEVRDIASVVQPVTRTVSDLLKPKEPEPEPELEIDDGDFRNS